MAQVDGLGDAAIRDILTRVRRIAVVGASPNPLRPSHDVLGVLINRGYETFPSTRTRRRADRREAGFRAARDVPAAVDMVDVFRNSAAAGDAVDAALALAPLPR